MWRLMTLPFFVAELVVDVCGYGVALSDGLCVYTGHYSDEQQLSVFDNTV